MSHSKGLRFVRSFLERVGVAARSVPGTLPPPTGAFWSKDGEGMLFLDAELSREYRRVVQEILTKFARQEDLSEYAVDSALRDAVFESVDIPKQRSRDPNVRINNALTTLRTVLKSSPKEYKCWVPVGGLDAESLPARFGPVRFLKCDEERISALTSHRNVELGTDESASIAYFEDIVSESLLDRPIAIVTAEARDGRAAVVLGERQVRAAIECVNFFSDLIPYCLAWLFIPPPDAAASHPVLRLAVAPDGSIQGDDPPRVRPLGHVSLTKLREGAEPIAKAVEHVENMLCQKHPNKTEKILLNSVRWGGRASVAATLEESFLQFAISLECVLLPIQKQELSFRLSQRVARVLGRNVEERARIAKRTKELYRIRSKIVHDGHYEVTKGERDEIRMLAKNTVLKLLLTSDVQLCANLNDLDHYFNKLTLE